MSAAINVAVIGCGTWGANHARIYQKHPCARLVAVCDANPAKAQALARELGVAESYSDYREMFDKCACDAVSIVTPDFAHTAPLLAACEYKKHILLEKPVATKRTDLPSRSIAAPPSTAPPAGPIKETSAERSGGKSAKAFLAVS